MNHLAELRALEEAYIPSAETLDLARGKKLIIVMGTFAVGKTSLMKKISEIDDRFTEVLSFTTRPRREKNESYRFIDNTDLDIGLITEKANSGQLMNFAVHPTTNHVYGSEASDYKSEYNLLSTTTRSYEVTKNLPFQEVKPLVVVADPIEWKQRISMRSMSHMEHTQRLQEAKSSLQWSLERQNDILFVDNTSDDLDGTARSIVSIVTGNARPTTIGAQIASDMLSMCNYV